MSTAAVSNGPLAPVRADLIRALRPKAGQAQGQPAWATRPRQARKMGNAAHLELLLDDEVTRRESRSAILDR